MPQTKGTHIFLKFSLYPIPLYIFSLFKTPKNTSKKTSNFLDSCIFTNNSRQCSCTQSSSPWFYTLDLGFRGMDVAFLAIIHTPSLLNIFLAFIYKYIYIYISLNNMIYCFLQHGSCFMCVSSLDLLVVMSYAMFYVQIYLLTCLYVQIYMLRFLCHAFLCFVPLFVLC